jgi:hypothetical protein
VKKRVFSNFPEAFWEIALYEVGNFIMKNNFLNNNGVSLLHTKKTPKTKVEIQSIVVDQSRLGLTNYSITADNQQATEISK